MLRRFTYGALARASKAVFTVVALAGPAAADRVDILALGDSLTAGYGLMDHEGFVPQMREWLADRGHDVRLVNAGVSGDTTAGGLSRVAWSLTPEIDAMIVALGGNDLLRGIPPEAVRANLQGILEVAQEADLDVMIVGMEAPGNYGPDYKQAFDAIYPDLAAAHGALHHPSFFVGLMDDTTSPADLQPFMQADGIHPNAEGVARIVGGMGPAIEDLIARVQQGPGS